MLHINLISVRSRWILTLYRNPWTMQFASIERTSRYFNLHTVGCAGPGTRVFCPKTDYPEPANFPRVPGYFLLLINGLFAKILNKKIRKVYQRKWFNFDFSLNGWMKVTYTKEHKDIESPLGETLTCGSISGWEVTKQTFVLKGIFHNKGHSSCSLANWHCALIVSKLSALDLLPRRLDWSLI